MYDFETEYRRIFETPLEEIKEDIFFRADNFENEKWYGDLFLVPQRERQKQTPPRQKQEMER